jgi:hypothetical protein
VHSSAKRSAAARSHVQRFEAGSLAAVTQVDAHADPVHAFDQAPTERAQPGVARFMAAAGKAFASL